MTSVCVVPFYLATGPITYECGSTVGVTGMRKKFDSRRDWNEKELNDRRDRSGSNM